MKTNYTTEDKKYYNYRENRVLSLGVDVCSIEEWQELHEKKVGALHPLGFLIFIPPFDIDASDEYQESDPYSVEERIDSDFHVRRKICTLQLMKEAMAETIDIPRILDIGCGQGHITAAIQREFTNAEVSAIDYSISAIKYAVGNFQHIDFAVGNAYNLPYAKAYFDVVICNNLWEHVSDPLVLLRGITHVLKPSGFLIISTPSRYRFGNLLRVLQGKPVVFMSSHHVTEYSVGQVIEQLHYGGYRVRRTFSQSIKLNSFKARLVKTICVKFLALVKSHHQLESTVFFLAQQNGNL